MLSKGNAVHDLDPCVRAYFCLFAICQATLQVILPQAIRSTEDNQVLQQAVQLASPMLLCLCICSTVPHVMITHNEGIQYLLILSAPAI